MKIARISFFHTIHFWECSFYRRHNENLLSMEDLLKSSEWSSFYRSPFWGVFLLTEPYEGSFSTACSFCYTKFTQDHLLDLLRKIARTSYERFFPHNSFGECSFYRWHFKNLLSMEDPLKSSEMYVSIEVPFEEYFLHTEPYEEIFSKAWSLNRSFHENHFKAFFA